MPGTFPFRITVCGFAELAEQSYAGVSHVLSLLDPDASVPPELASLPDRRLQLRFHDIIDQKPGLDAPGPEHVRQLLALAREILTSGPVNPHLLIHCHAGFSRSPAALAVLLAHARPSLFAEAIAAEVLRIRPNAWPNLRIIELGDRIICRRGELIEGAGRIYRRRLAQEPGLADMLIANGRAREVEAARD